MEQPDSEDWMPSAAFTCVALKSGGSLLTHNRQSILGSSDYALGALLMKAEAGGQHRFLLTVAASRSSTGTGIRLGVATDDGSRVCAIRPWDGQLYPSSHGDPRVLFMPAKSVGREVEVVVDYDKRRLSFRIDGEGDVLPGILPEYLPNELRPWAQCLYEGDAVILSGYRFIPCSSPTLRDPSRLSAREGRAGYPVTPMFGRPTKAFATSPTPDEKPTREGTGMSASITHEHKQQLPPPPPPQQQQWQSEQQSSARGANSRDLSTWHARPFAREDEESRPTPTTESHWSPYARGDALADDSYDADLSQLIPAQRAAQPYASPSSTVAHEGAARTTSPVGALEDVWDSSNLPSRSQMGLISMAAIKAAVRAARKEVAASHECSPAGATGSSPRGADAASCASDWSAGRWLATGSGYQSYSPWQVGSGSVEAYPDSAPRLISRAHSSCGDHVMDAVATAIVAPLRMQHPPGELSLAYIRALSAQPDRRLAVERLLRDGRVLETIAHQICLAADSLGANGSSTVSEQDSRARTPSSQSKRGHGKSGARGSPGSTTRRSPATRSTAVRIQARLDELAELRRAGHVTMAEYTAKRRQILEDGLLEMET